MENGKSYSFIMTWLLPFFFMLYIFLEFLILFEE